MIRRVTLDIMLRLTAQDDGPPASHCLATVHPFTVSPSGPNQGEQLGQWELFYKGELLVIPLYTNSNTDKLNNGIAPPYTSPLLLSRSPLRTHTKIPNPNTKISQQNLQHCNHHAYHMTFTVTTSGKVLIYIN